ncbi:MAG: 2-hydroxychromene-2-carboxylate isomerase [Xanthobacteraceae bacterium]|nr:2-hydroxychromene-2-carboxylate isomerase [Xanthobacteraceae bacterium]PWB60341.1 MAG: disulfide bond formation protein DsbA [Bradyrhizobiaceae bacterium]GIL00579.1 MAG: 2-hydroxychromene-2-carboxylate isomerase [Alphaproteobacteria bacterium]
MAVLDFYFDFASTYSYPAAVRIGALAEAAGVTLRWRPFLLGPIFKAQGLETSPFNLFPVKGRYMVRDIERLCADLDLAFRLPDPFPQHSLLAGRVGMVGVAEGWIARFAPALYRAEFAERRRIDDPAVVGDVLAGLGLDPQATLARAQSDEIKGALRAATEAAQNAGVFGAPSFVTEKGELFWGNDRLEQALAWAARGRA